MTCRSSARRKTTAVIMESYQPEERHAIPAIGFCPQTRVTTGTTLIAMEFDGGVVVGTDSRTSAGQMVVSRVTNKITPITDRLVVCRSGTSADTQAIADIVKYQIEAFSMLEGERLSVFRSAQIFRQFLYEYRESLGASVIVAGYDEKEGGQIYAIPMGGLVTRQRTTASGSGSTYVSGFLSEVWKPNMTKEECVAAVKKAVFHAVSLDGSSGGVIRIGVVTAEGTAISLHRADDGGFPTVHTPKPYPTYSKHITCE